MSSTALPISPTRFATALTTLTLPTLYAKHAELSNQIAHLVASNTQLEEYAREHDDRECYEAVVENREVLRRFEERRALVVKEVREVRGLEWKGEGESESERAGGDVAGAAVETSGAEARRGERREQQQGEGEGQGEDGVYL
ncbi:hypothetical protein IAQ61_006068 [Plenodomus lingam]|uniref:uncharacterized protein n=1 Tax=Leptosphaeria maculans TaxID=5022 RepID=UPI00331A3222|nr:hypothetical protein IAQ61_006068 [Plenodomus lingam]